MKKLMLTRLLNFGGRQMSFWCEVANLNIKRDDPRKRRLRSSSTFGFHLWLLNSEHLKLASVELKKGWCVNKKSLKWAQGNKKSRLIVWTFSHQNSARSFGAKNDGHKKKAGH